MSRPLLYGADGTTPIAVESDETKERALLLACFGVIGQINQRGRAIQGADLYERQQRLLAAIVDELGQDVVERYYNIQLAPSDEPGPVLPVAGGVQ
jgi:hypothetical protein